ncbi:uncharacterized protein G2W53_001190 [Senna tora]|uniref:Uncharacterized protein n=1 Tax=Senna tora TaxID=362788 RepID=A0A834XF35_9FABA|nr:uncharacterized protein G2W53_001190 [Senna tora]
MDPGSLGANLAKNGVPRRMSWML